MKNHDAREKFSKSWGVTEFALLYFPEASPKTAYKRTYSWIQASKELQRKLREAGWQPFQKTYTPKQVNCLIEHVGEP